MSSFEDRVSAVVQSVLSDPLQLPSDFTDALPQIVAQNPVAAVGTGIITFALKTSSVTATGTTFAGGTDVLTSPLAFTATGKDSYLLTVVASSWSNSAAAQNQLHLNLDGADDGIFGYLQIGANLTPPLNASGVIVGPSAGSHTINARLMVNAASTATIGAGSGGAATNTPILVALSRIAIGN